jgi:hypothetical protein
MFSLEPDLSQHFNYGIVPPPDLDWDPPRLQRPAWQPTAAQARTARWQVALGIVVLALLAFALLLLAFGRF